MNVNSDFTFPSSLCPPWHSVSEAGDRAGKVGTCHRAGLCSLLRIRRRVCRCCIRSMSRSAAQRAARGQIFEVLRAECSGYQVQWTWYEHSCRISSIPEVSSQAGHTETGHETATWRERTIACRAECLRRAGLPHALDEGFKGVLEMCTKCRGFQG